MIIISMCKNIKHQVFSIVFSGALLCGAQRGDRWRTPLSVAWRPWNHSLQSRGTKSPYLTAQPLGEHQRYSPLTGGGPDSLAPSIQIRLCLRFNLGCESTDVIRTENKWEHQLQNKEHECFLDLVQLDDQKTQTGSRVAELAFETDSCVWLSYPPPHFQVLYFLQSKIPLVEDTTT